MPDHRILLDAFAEARRSWDDLVGLQPDVMAGSGNLEESNLAELEQRVAAHREAMDVLADAFDILPAYRADLPSARNSDRESAEDARDQYPPLDSDAPEPAQASGRAGKSR